jgi:Fe-S-cluster containining protein
MTERKKREMALCRMCGRCCSMEIPLTLLDIHRLAEFRGTDESKAFTDIVQDKISPRSSLFMIRKNDDGACLFLTDKNGCSIHPAKPNACRFYSCSLQARSDFMPWTAMCTDPSQRARLWEQSVAAMVTKAYIEKNSSAWNETDYHMALKGILQNIPLRYTQKLKLARDKKGMPMAMIYDCSECEKQGACAKETPVTLDDVRRISTHLGMTWKGFFKACIAPEASSVTGGLMLKRDRHCIFFESEKQCSVEKVKPFHCRFTPCPNRIKTSEMMDALFLGSGTVEEQFRHQVAMATTRDYVYKCGAQYRKRDMELALKKMNKLTANGNELTRFCKQIVRFRYVDDTLSILETGNSKLDAG